MSRARASLLGAVGAAIAPLVVLACSPQVPPADPPPPAASSAMTAAAPPAEPTSPVAIAIAPAPIESGSPAIASVYPKLDAETLAQRKTSAEALLTGGVSLPDDGPANPRRVTVIVDGTGDGFAIRSTGLEESRCRHRLLPKPGQEIPFTLTVTADGTITAAKLAAPGGPSTKAFVACAEAALRRERFKLPAGEHKGRLAFDQVP